MRCDLALFHSPKLLTACHRAGNGAGWLYLQGLAYAVEHLTDGWIPDYVPRRAGATEAEIEALEHVGLWIPLEVTDDGGWLVHDFADYQVTREQWEQISARNRANAHQRWQARHLRAVDE